MLTFKFINDKRLRREIESLIEVSDLFADFAGMVRFYDHQSIYLEGDFTQAQLILIARILEMLKS